MKSDQRSGGETKRRGEEGRATEKEEKRMEMRIPHPTERY